MSKIEAARQEREARKNAIANNLQSEKEARLAEIEKMKQDQLAKMQGMNSEERLRAEAQFNAEKARLESEFNEKMLKSQREAAPSETANSPAKTSSQAALEETQKVVRIKPQSIAMEAAPIRQPIESPKVSDKRSPMKMTTPKKSAVSGRSSAAPSPVGGGAHMSMLQTADEASGFDNSFVASEV